MVISLQRIISVTTKFTSEEANMGYCSLKKPKVWKKADKNYRKPEELARVIMFSSQGPMGWLKSNGV